MHAEDVKTFFTLCGIDNGNQIVDSHLLDGNALLTLQENQLDSVLGIRALGDRRRIVARLAKLTALEDISTIGQ